MVRQRIIYSVKIECDLNVSNVRWLNIVVFFKLFLVLHFVSSLIFCTRFRKRHCREWRDTVTLFVGNRPSVNWKGSKVLKTFFVYRCTRTIQSVQFQHPLSLNSEPVECVTHRKLFRSSLTLAGGVFFGEQNKHVIPRGIIILHIVFSFFIVYK